MDMVNRSEWEIVAAVELHEILNRLIVGDIKTIEQLASELKFSQQHWENFCKQTCINISGVDFPVNEDLSETDKSDNP